MSDLQRFVRGLVVGCFAFAALLGVVVLVVGRSIGETELRVLATTTTVGVESVAVLAYLAAARVGHPLPAAAGGAVSLVATGLVLWLVWGGEPTGDAVWNVLWTAVAVAVALAQVCLLLSATGGHVRDEALMLATFAATAVLTGLLVGPLWAAEGAGTFDGYGRVLGVVAILDVLGTVVVAATRRRPAVDAVRTSLSAESRRRLEDVARTRGVTPDQLVDDLLR
ncbi:hypothetical protein [Aeromicrobium massiliense]|uniref:hypothetical protein n=1 Tax=Aeromicrobium massiliense TaxID=1464554 RepID=UPI00031A7BC2|nr:hypothetical protein [Aeromicrobium massiliense]